MKTLRISDIAVIEILEALELSAQLKKMGKPKTFKPFSEIVIKHINEQLQEQPED